MRQDAIVPAKPFLFFFYRVYCEKMKKKIGDAEHPPRGCVFFELWIEASGPKQKVSYYNF